MWIGVEEREGRVRWREVEKVRRDWRERDGGRRRWRARWDLGPVLKMSDDRTRSVGRCELTLKSDQTGIAHDVERDLFGMFSVPLVHILLDPSHVTFGTTGVGNEVEAA